MKKTFLALLLVLLASGIATAFTWEGELDPNEFDKWELVGIIPTPSGYSWVIIDNPDKASRIGHVAMLVDSGSNVLGYRYFKDGEPHGFFFDIQQQKYAQYDYDEGERKQCMACHQDKVTEKMHI